MKTIPLFCMALIAAGFASCSHTEQKTDYDAALKQIIDSAGIPMIQAKYVSPTDTIYCQVGMAPWGETSSSDSRQAIFQAASLSKVVFAYCVLRMYDKGEIDIDRPLYQYTDIERFTDKETAKRLTARLVLMHRSGLNDWAASPSSEQWPTAPINFIFPPDSIFSYSGEAYAFLQRAVESIKGKTIQEIAQEEVFDRLGMTLSSYEWKPEYEGITTASTKRNGESQGVRQFPRQNVAYTLRTCAQDYSKFLRALLEGNGLKPETHALMIIPSSGPATQYPPKVRPIDQKQSIFWGLGIGIEENTHYGRVLWHWGDNGNTKALFIILPAQKKSLVYFANSGAGHDIINQVTELFFQDPQPFYITEWINQE